MIDYNSIEYRACFTDCIYIFKIWACKEVDMMSKHLVNLISFSTCSRNEYKIC